MHKKLITVLELLFTFSLFLNFSNSAYACSPAPDAKPAKLTEKVQNAGFVFEGVVTEINDNFIKVKVEQYFKGEGLVNVKITHEKHSCADQFTLNQRALFFTQGNMGETLEAVYDGAFGSTRKMNTDNFSEITSTIACMATYQNNILTIPCIADRKSRQIYQANLNQTNSTTPDFTFIANNIQKIDKNIDNTIIKCIATYQDGNLIIPCLADKETKKVYQVKLTSQGSVEDFKFALNTVQQVTHSIMILETFDKNDIGSIPDNWTAGITGMGNYNWALADDNTAPSLSQVMTQSAKGDYPWLIEKNSQLTNGFIQVKFKPISGRIDQAAGLIWRWKDPYNYYVARANALENNISIYYMKDGERHSLKYKDVPSDLSVQQNTWQTLRVDFNDNRFIVSFEGRIIIDINDEHIQGEGAVGLWTKEDSETSFDDFSYGAI